MSGPNCVTGSARETSASPRWGAASFNRIAGWILAFFLLSAIALLVWFLPVVAGVLFVALVTFLAVAEGRARGIWSGVKIFIKEILFGW